MKKHIIYSLISILMLSGISSCSNSEKTEHSGEEHQESHEDHDEEGGSHEDHGEKGGMQEVHLPDLKFNSLGMKVDTLPQRLMSATIHANGQLRVPPQHEASVTAILGANITSIKVIEGDKVKNGQVLAYVAHPNLAKLQTDYINSYNQLQFLRQDYERQKKLYDEKVGSGQVYQQALADYQSKKGEVKGYEAQLKQLKLNINKIQEGNIYENIPIVSPIDGYIEKVLVQVGQYADPQTKMFLIVNTDHIHADLMVFEKDVHKVKKGQTVTFVMQSAPDKSLTAEIFAVGKKFEQNPKAVHVHAEIKKTDDNLIPGMYINGKIHAENNRIPAVPEEAIIEEDGKPYLFIAEKHNEDGETEWAFRPLEIRTGITSEGWVEVKLLEPLNGSTTIALNNAYYLVSEMKKSQTSHSH